MTDDDILAAIEEKRYATAKREIAARISRYPRKLYYRALNALYLVATAPAHEAAEACHAVRKQNPHDAQTLDLLFECYSKLSLRDEARSVYENAAKKNPSDGFLMIWFKKAYSTFDYSMLRASTAALTKKSPSSRAYKFYFAFATYMWSLSQDDAVEPLESAISSIAKVQPFQNSDEICLYAKLLARTGRKSEVVQLLRSEVHKPLELVLMYLEALEDTENWTALVQECETLLFKEAFNDYNTWKRFIKASFKLGRSRGETASKIELSSRNSYVANIYLNEVYGVSLEKPIETYYDVFQSKPCCALDLSNFDVPESFINKINSTKDVVLASKDVSSNDISVLINTEKINSFNGSEVDWKLYSSFENPELSDVFLASMIQKLHSGFNTSDTMKYIVQLEKFATKDPENFYIKLWLLNLYSLLNVPSLAIATYQDLKIKMIQHDVLSYKLRLNPSLQNLNHLVQIYRFYMTSEKEVADYIEIALKKGLYTKLEDLFRFGKRLSESLQRHLIVANILRMSRILGHDYYGFFLNIVQSKRGDVLDDTFTTSDNRDFETDYKIGFKLDKISLFSQEKNITSQHVRLYYAKELLIAEQNLQHVPDLLEVFESLISNEKVMDALSPSEQHFFRLHLNIFKACKGDHPKKEQCVEDILKNADFAVIKESFLAKTTPLSTSANQILINVSEIIKVIKLISEDERLLALATQLQKSLVGYVITNPELSFFKEIKSSCDFDSDASLVEAQMGRIEDAARDAKFKLK